MDERWQKVFYLIGIIVTLYLVLRYVLPALLTMLGIVISTVFTLFFWAIIVLTVLASVLYLADLFRSRNN